MRKWISMVSVAALGDEAGGGLLKLCELIGAKIGMAGETNELFLMGLLSVMDALLNISMSEVLSEIPANEAIKNALLGSPSRYRPVF